MNEKSVPESLRHFVEQVGVLSYARACESYDIDNYGGIDGETDIEDAAGGLDDLAFEYWDRIDRAMVASLFYRLPEAEQKSSAVKKVMQEACDIYLTAVMARPDYAHLGHLDASKLGVQIGQMTVMAPLSGREEDERKV